MGKTQQDSGKLTQKNIKNTKTISRNNNNNKNQKHIKQKAPPRRENKGAEIIRQKKQAEKAEKERRKMEFKKKRLEKTKVISKKTSRGQPLMKNRIEYLLKQIQEMKKH